MPRLSGYRLSWPAEYVPTVRDGSPSDTTVSAAGHPAAFSFKRSTRRFSALRFAASLVLLLFAPLRALKDAAQNVWNFPVDYRAWRLLQDGLNQQIREYYESKGIPVGNTRAGSVRPRRPIC